jgi:cell division protein FtsL
MSKKTGKRLKLLKGEKFMYAILVLLLVLIPVANVFSKALLSKTNIEVEQWEQKINKQTAANQSLNMQINELASLDNIQAVAEQYGLSYKYGNIKIIEGD